MEIEYYYVKQVNASIDIEDVGNCCLVARNDIGMAYYVYTKTDMGTTQMLTAGPVYEGDDEVFPDFVDVQYTSMQYNMKKIGKLIEKFVNNPKAGITQVEEITTWQFIDAFPKLNRIIG